MKKDPIHPLLRIASVFLPVIIAVVSATIGIIILEKSPTRKQAPTQIKKSVIKNDTNNYKPKNNK